MNYDFKKQLIELGLKKGDVILMHSSMKSLNTNISPMEFIDEILACIGAEGTLLVPAFTYDNVNEENPNFSIKKTEPCVGLISKIFLQKEGVIRSLHPTHSLSAYGKHAKEIISKHILDNTPVGKNSPIMQLLNYKGKILFIGDVLNTCTFMHGVEEIVKTPYTLSEEYISYNLEDENGLIIQKDIFPHNFKGWGAEYQRINDILSYPSIKNGTVGNANCYLVDAISLLKESEKKLRENPYYFVTDISSFI